MSSAGISRHTAIRQPTPLLEGLEVIPPRQIEHGERAWAEPDVDAILVRRPDIVLIDDLAHANAPTSRHLKRYQDVLELRAAGIEVYTALDVQNLESLKDVVAQITGITVHETVPDGVLDEADEIKLVDLPTAELLQRAREGKVYVPGLSQRAFQQLFRPGNLAALRQLTLRRVAERVDMQMRAYMQTPRHSGSLAGRGTRAGLRRLPVPWANAW